MQIVCDNCGDYLDLKDKKLKKKGGYFVKSTKITICPSCGKKVFFKILDKYNKSEFNFT